MFYKIFAFCIATTFFVAGIPYESEIEYTTISNDIFEKSKTVESYTGKPEAITPYEVIDVNDNPTNESETVEISTSTSTDTNSSEIEESIDIFYDVETTTLDEIKVC